MKQVINIVLFVVLLAALAYGVGLLVTDGDVPVQAEFENKVVYTTDQSIKTAPLTEDCRRRGGEFNVCGNVCSPDADACDDVCAYTCELAPVSDRQTNIIESTIGSRVSTLGISIVPQEVLEDSRCPSDVQCVRAGTVRLSAQFAFDATGATTTDVLTLGVATTTGGYRIELLSVDPVPKSDADINPQDYQFRFEVTEPRNTDA